MFKRGIQFCIFLKNRPGTFGELCELLYENTINLMAVSLHAESELGVLRMVVDNPGATEKLLKREGIPFLQSEVLIVEVPNRAGMAAGVGHRLNQADIDIEYTYFSASLSDVPALMVFKVSDLSSALAKLQKSSKDYN